MKKRILSILLSTTLVLSMVGCGSNSSATTENETTAESTSSETEKIVLRLGEQASCKYFTLAEQEGILDEYFADFDYEVEFYDFGGGPAMNESFAAEELDAGILGVSPAISGISNDYGYRIVSKIVDTFGGTWLITTPDSGITCAADLKGKKVGTTLGGSWQYILDVWLEEEGLSESDIELINTGSETATSIRAGEIDAAVQNAATSSTLIDEGSAMLVTNESAVSQADMIVLTDEFAETYPEFTTQFMLAMDATAQWIAENPDEYIAFYAENTGSEEEIVKATFDLYTYGIELTDADVEYADGQLEFVKSQGSLADDSITVDELFNLDVLEAAGY